MSENKTEDAAKKRVREETEPIERSDAPGKKPERPEDAGEDSGTCSRICGVTSRTPRIQKKG